MCGLGYAASCSQDSECGSGLCRGGGCTVGYNSDPCDSGADCIEPGAECINHPYGGPHGYMCVVPVSTGNSCTYHEDCQTGVCTDSVCE